VGRPVVDDRLPLVFGHEVIEPSLQEPDGEMPSPSLERPPRGKTHDVRAGQPIVGTCVDGEPGREAQTLQLCVRLGNVGRLTTLDDTRTTKVERKTREPSDEWTDAAIVRG